MSLKAPKKEKLANPRKSMRMRLEETAQNKVIVGNVALGKCIGKGAYGKVYEGLELTTGKTVAVKSVEYAEDIPVEELNSLEMEINLLSRLSHPSILKYFSTIRSEKALHIVLEYIEKGSLTDLLKKIGLFPEDLCAKFIKQVLEGLEYLHSQGVIHRDIKSANILLTKDADVKLADFGVATRLDQANKSDSVVGTPYWMAPEIIDMSGGTGTACDIWSLGCTVVELIGGEPPYFDLDPMPALFRIVQDDHPPLPPGISPLCENFLLLCFQKNPALRSTATQLLSHPWIKNIRAQTRQITTVNEEFEDDETVEMINETLRGVDREELNTAMAQMKMEEDKKVRFEFASPDDDEEGDPFEGISDDEEEEETPPPVSVADRLSMFSEQPSDTGSMQMPAIAQIDISKLNANHQQDWNEDDDDESDLFGFEDEDMDHVADPDVKIFEEVKRLTAAINPNVQQSKDMERALKSLQRLQELVEGPSRESVFKAINFIGVVWFLEMLGVQDEKIQLHVLRVLLAIMKDSTKISESLCLVGLVPAVAKLMKDRYVYKIRAEAAKITQYFCMYQKDSFISSGGLQSLVMLVDQRNYEHYKELLMTGIDCIELVMDTHKNPKSDFCRLFCKAGLIKPLIAAMLNLENDKRTTKSQAYLIRVVDLIHMFAGNGKSVVREALAKRYVLEGLMVMLDHPLRKVQVTVLKTFYSLANEISTRDSLEKIGLIPRLVRLMDSPHSDVLTQVMPSLLNLFQIKTSRQEQMALCGIIPHLQRFVLENHVVKNIVLTMICQLASTSQRTRLELKKHSGVEFYLNILKVDFWRSRALEALAVWMTDDPVRIEATMTQSHNLTKVILAFKHANKNEFEELLKPLKKILMCSKKICIALGSSSTFLRCCVSRFEKNEAIIQKPLLEIIRTLLEASPDRSTFGRKEGLIEVLQQLAKSDKVLVQNLAEGILVDLERIVAVQE